MVAAFRSSLGVSLFSRLTRKPGVQRRVRLGEVGGGGQAWVDSLGRWGGGQDPGSDRRPPPPHPSLLPGLPAASPARQPHTCHQGCRAAYRMRLISSSSRPSNVSHPLSTKGGVSQVAQGLSPAPVPPGCLACRPPDTAPQDPAQNLTICCSFHLECSCRDTLMAPHQAPPPTACLLK